MLLSTLSRMAFLGSSSAAQECKFKHARVGEDPARSYTKTQFRNENDGFFPIGVCHFLILKIFHTPICTCTCNSYNLDYILSVQECFSSWNSSKTGWRKIRRGSGMSWRQLAWPPDVNACQTQLQHSTAASSARVFRKISSRSSLGNGLYSASCRRNGNGCCCQGDLAIISQSGSHTVLSRCSFARNVIDRATNNQQRRQYLSSATQKLISLITDVYLNDQGH